MGYYDGMSFDSSTASTYEVAFETGTPAVLVVNASGMSLTLSAVINGLNDFRENSMIKGIILNNIKAGTYKMLNPLLKKKQVYRLSDTCRIMPILFLKADTWD